MSYASPAQLAPARVEPAPPRLQAWEAYALIVILALATGFRVARITYGSLSFDEMWHLELSTGRGSPHVRTPENQFIANAPAVTSLTGAPSVFAVWTNMDFVVHPPLYVTLLRIWREIFGEGDIAARSYSIFCSLVAIAFMFLAARIWNGIGIAIWAALIFAVAPTQIFLAQFVRGYDQLAAFGMIAMYCLARLECGVGSVAKSSVGLAVGALGMMLSHYFGAGACAAIGIYVLLRFRGKLLRTTLLSLASSAAVFFIIWGPFLWKQRTFFADTADVWLIEQTPDHLILTLGRLASWCWWLVMRNAAATRPYAMLSAIVLVGPPVAMLIRRRMDMLPWYLWLLGTLGFVAALDFFRSTSHLKFDRYVSLASPAVFVLMVAMVSRLPVYLRHVLPAAIVAVALLDWWAPRPAGPSGIVESRLAFRTEGEPDWREYGRIVDEHVGEGEPLIFYQGTLPRWYIEIFYLGAAHYSKKFPRPIVKLSTIPMSQDASRQIKSKTAWLVSAPFREDVSDIAPGAKRIGEEQYVLPNLAIFTHIELAD